MLRALSARLGLTKAPATALQVAQEYGMPKLTGKTAVITGGTSGVGLETARVLSRLGANVIIGGRHQKSASRAIADIEARNGDIEAPGTLTFSELDLGSVESVHRFVNRFMVGGGETPASPVGVPHLDYLFLNAAHFGSLQPTPDGLDPHIQVNHLSHFALLEGLHAPLSVAAPSRVIVSASPAHASASSLGRNLLCPPGGSGLTEWPFVRTAFAWPRYATSKLMNVLLTREAAERLAPERISVNSCSVGLRDLLVARDLPAPLSNIFASIELSPQQYAAGAVRVALDPRGKIPVGYVGPSSYAWQDLDFDLQWHKDEDGVVEAIKVEEVTVDPLSALGEEEEDEDPLSPPVWRGLFFASGEPYAPSLPAEESGSRSLQAVLWDDTVTALDILRQKAGIEYVYSAPSDITAPVGVLPQSAGGSILTGASPPSPSSPSSNEEGDVAAVAAAVAGISAELNNTAKVYGELSPELEKLATDSVDVRNSTVSEIKSSSSSHS